MCIKMYSVMRIFYTVMFVYSFVVFMLVRYTSNSTDNLSQTQPVSMDSGRWTNQSESVPMDKIPDWDNITTVPLYSDTVINPHPFNFTMSNQEACMGDNDTYDDIFLVILVKCRPNETYDRQQIRRTWGGVTEVLGRRTLTMFLLGQAVNATVNRQLLIENGVHHDFIQEDFIDAYHNMTYKNIMGLKWVTLLCPRVSYVLSIDSDMVLNIYNLVKRLVDMPRAGFAEGNLRLDPLPHRHRSSKWYTPYEIYPEPTYAPFLNGACYVMSGDVATGVYRESEYVRFLRWDDVFIGLVMQRIGVRPRLCELYEQFLATRIALKRGIAKGTRHNIHHVNTVTIKIWDSVVGKLLRDEEGVSPVVWALLLCNICFVLLVILFGCLIHWIISSEIPKSESFQV